MTTTAPPGAATLEFGPLRIAYDDRLLRPRPWTVAQSEWAAELLVDQPDGPVLELCAGAGHIGLLAVLGTGRSLVCVDVDPAACAYARENAAAAGLGDRVATREGPMDEVLEPAERFPLVIADPPWVRRDEVGRYPEDPDLAIDGGADGLDLAWTCVDVARRHLLPGGSLLLQLGSLDQVAALRQRLAGEARSLAVREVREAGGSDRGVLVHLQAVDHHAAVPAACHPGLA